MFISVICNGQFYQHKTKTDFVATYYQNENQITSKEKLTLKITGNKWSHSDKQGEAIWIYHSSSKNKRKFGKQFSIGWFKADTTGFIESEKGVWIHPPRQNQYSITEIAPFPCIKKDVLVGDVYQNMLKIGKGWGNWSDVDVEFNYSVEYIKPVNTDTIWKIIAYSELESKMNTCEFIYSNEKGFISFKYAFYNGDNLLINKKE